MNYLEALQEAADHYQGNRTVEVLNALYDLMQEIQVGNIVVGYRVDLDADTPSNAWMEDYR